MTKTRCLMGKSPALMPNVGGPLDWPAVGDPLAEGLPLPVPDEVGPEAAVVVAGGGVPDEVSSLPALARTATSAPVAITSTASSTMNPVRLAAGPRPPDGLR